jgi:transcriptional regulator with XRE-family HTH domain
MAAHRKHRRATNERVVRKRRRKPPREAAPAGLVSDLRQLEGPLVQLFADLTGDLTDGVMRLAARTGEAPLRVARALLPIPRQVRLPQPEQLEMMRETGLYLRDLRQLAGLTLNELSEAINLQDRTLLEAVENGTATLSFELILRLAALLARHDPIPFVIRFTRTYNPAIWKLLQDWGIGRLPVQYERERQFLNVFRRHDAARTLSDEGFDKVLGFTRAAFELSLHFIAEQEGVRDASPAEPKGDATARHPRPPRRR